MYITEKTKLEEIRQWMRLSEENNDFGNLCFSRAFHTLKEEDELIQMGERACKMAVEAFNRTAKLQESGMQVVHPLYTAEEIAAENDKRASKLLFYPGEPDKPCIVIIPGGGYRMLAVLEEGIMDAFELNRLGYSAAVLCHRVDIVGLMPRPLEDLARLVKLILTEKQFPCDQSRYIVAGFSSGGHVAGLWCSKELGFRHYELPAPCCVFAAYALVSATLRAQMLELGLGTKNDLAHAEMLFTYLTADNMDPKLIEQFDVEKLVDDQCPPCYLIHGTDDIAVYCRNSELWAQALEQHNIPHVLHLVEHIGHAFGMGQGTPAQGWIEQALAFCESVS